MLPGQAWLLLGQPALAQLLSLSFRVSGDGQFSHDEDRPDGNGALAAWKLGDATSGGASRAVGGEGIFNPDSAVASWGRVEGAFVRGSGWSR